MAEDLLSREAFGPCQLGHTADRLADPQPDRGHRGLLVLRQHTLHESMVTQGRQGAIGARRQLHFDDPVVSHLGPHFVRRSLEHLPALVDDRQPVRQFLGFVEIVGRIEDRDAVAPAQVLQQAPQRAGPVRIEADRRLVEQQHGRPMDEGHGDRQALLHAHGVPLHVVVEAVRQAHDIGHLLDAVSRSVAAKSIEAGEVLQVLPPGDLPVDAALAPDGDPDAVTVQSPG